jgi:hypothetical protein
MWKSCPPDQNPSNKLSCISVILYELQYTGAVVVVKLLSENWGYVNGWYGWENGDRENANLLQSCISKLVYSTLLWLSGSGEMLMCQITGFLGNRNGIPPMQGATVAHIGHAFILFGGGWPITENRCAWDLFVPGEIAFSFHMCNHCRHQACSAYSGYPELWIWLRVRHPNDSATTI